MHPMMLLALSQPLPEREWRPVEAGILQAWLDVFDAAANEVGYVVPGICPGCTHEKLRVYVEDRALWQWCHRCNRYLHASLQRGARPGWESLVLPGWVVRRAEPHKIAAEVEARLLTRAQSTTPAQRLWGLDDGPTPPTGGGPWGGDSHQDRLARKQRDPRAEAKLTAAEAKRQRRAARRRGEGSP